MTINYEFDYEDFEYEANYDDIKFAFIEILAKEYEIAEEKIKKLVNDFDISYLNYLDEFKEEYKDYFRDEALEQYEDYKLYNKDPMNYYGVNQSDFI